MSFSLAKPSTDIGSRLKQFIRGSQLFFHNFRMFKQVFRYFVVGGFLLTLIFTTCWFFHQTTAYQRYLVNTWMQANFWTPLDGNSRQFMRQPNGETYVVFSKSILESPAVQQAVSDAKKTAIEGLLLGSVLSVGLFLMAALWLQHRGLKQGEDQLLEGSYLTTPRQLNRLIRKTLTQKNVIRVGGLPIPPDAETSHVMFHGASGSGKTLSINEVLDGIRYRGEKTIVYCKHGDYTARYYRAGKDIILNNIDERGANWDMWGECQEAADFDNMASALIPMPVSQTTDPFWINAARTIFSAAAWRMDSGPDRTISQLLRYLLTADLDSLADLLKGTEAETLVSEKIAKTALCVKSVLATYLKCLKYSHRKQTLPPFSLRKWIEGKENYGLDNDSWVFVTSRADKHETLKPLISCWLDIAANALLSLPENRDNRLWITIDELPTLHRLPYLTQAMAEARKFGGCFVLGLQTIFQLKKLYGEDGAEEIVDACGTRFFFRSNGDKTCEWVSKELGEQLILESKESLSYGANTVRDGVSLAHQQTTRRIILPSQIKLLPKRVAYAQFLSNGALSPEAFEETEKTLPLIWPIARVKIPLKKRPHLAESFVEQPADESDIADIDQLVQTHENPSTEVKNALQKPPLQSSKTGTSAESNAKKEPKQKVRKTKKAPLSGVVSSMDDDRYSLE